MLGSLFLSALVLPSVAQSTDTLPDLGEPTANSGSVQPNVSAQGAGFNFHNRIDGKQITLTPQYSKQNGSAIGGSLASPVSTNMAVGVLFTVGSDKNEWLLNTGFDLTSNQRFILSLGQLRQKQDFSFISGTQKAQVRQDNGAISYQYFLGKTILNAAEVNAYISDTGSVDLEDKTYYTDTASLYELWSDPRRIAGGRVSGVQGRLVFTPTTQSTFKLGFGGERLRYDYLTGNDSTTRATGSAEFNQRLDHDFNLRASANAGASQSRYALGLGKRFTNGSQLGLDVANIQGRDNTFNDKQVMLSYTQSFGGHNSSGFFSSPMGMNAQTLNTLDASGTPINPAAGEAVNTTAPNASSQTWASALVDQVARRPSFLPAQAIAKIDTTATPTRLVVIDKTALPSGSSVATATGILTVPIGTAVSAIASITLNGSAFTNSSQFALSGSTYLVINPNLITQPAAGSTDTYVVTMNNTSGGGTTLATVTVSPGSTKIDSVVISSGVIVINTAAIAGVTAPVAGATPVTTTTAGTGYTGTVTWSPTVNGTFAYNTTYTATVTLTAASGYTLTGVAANFFTVSGATATNSANSGEVSALFPATTATLPSGYISSGGLTWAPITTTANWSTASSTCSASTALGYATGTWHQPTRIELEDLYANRNAVTPSGWPPTGWTLGQTWSFDTVTPGFHILIDLRNGNVGQTGDGADLYVSCVHVN